MIKVLDIEKIQRNTKIPYNKGKLMIMLLVTGCAGFIGSNFVYYHLQNHEESNIIGLDKLSYSGNLANLSELTTKEEFRFIKGDINDIKLLEKIFLENNVDAVVNFAAESHVDRSILDSRAFIQTNVLGTHCLLDIAKKIWFTDKNSILEKKFIQISTDEVYGSLGPTGHFTENTPLDPHSPYAASKAAADLIVKAYFDTYNFPSIITRCSNNYGPYQFPEKLIPLMINNALNHNKLPVYGDGKQIRDWIHVEDHCKAISMILQEGRLGEVYNIGAKTEMENLTLIKKILDILNKLTDDPLINYGLVEHVKDRLGHDRRYSIDPTKIINEIGWKPKIDFDSGIEATIKWYLDNRKWVENVISGEYLDYYKKIYSL